MSGVLSGAIDWRAKLLGTSAPPWSILVRLLVGLIVFVPEGIQKLTFPEILGAGRFANIGIPYSDLMGPFVGIVETVCGTAHHSRSAHQTRSHPADHHYDRGDCLDKSADPARL